MRRPHPGSEFNSSAHSSKPTLLSLPPSYEREFDDERLFLTTSCLRTRGLRWHQLARSIYSLLRTMRICHLGASSNRFELLIGSSKSSSSPEAKRGGYGEMSPLFVYDQPDTKAVGLRRRSRTEGSRNSVAIASF
jgi:hypothetical protein